jgi:hypothetical protein
MNSVQSLCIGFCLSLTCACATIALGQTSDATTSPTTIATTFPATAPPISPEEQSLIDQLNADDWHARQSAEDKLVALGDSTRPAMIWLSSSGDPEQRTRAQSVLARLNQAAASRPTLITLHMKETNPHEIFAAIAKQADLDIGFLPQNLWRQPGLPSSTISIDLDQQPFWDAIAQISRIAGARVQMINNGNGSRLTICQGIAGEDWFAGPRCVDGRFIVQPMQITRNQTVSFAPVFSKASSNQIQFQVLVDPKVSVLRVGSQAMLTEAVDDKGNSLATKSANLFGFQMGPALTFQVFSQLASVDDGASKLSKLSGIIGLTVAGQVEHLDLPDATAAINQVNTVGEWALTITSCHFDDRDGTFTATIRAPPQRNLDPNMVFSVMNQIRLVDAANRTISAGGGMWSGNGRRYQTQRNFSGSEQIHPPVSLKWDVPTHVERKEISFHFTDIPLPSS